MDKLLGIVGTCILILTLLYWCVVVINKIMTHYYITLSGYTKVVGLFYENLNLIIFSIVSATLTFLLMFYTLLTLDSSGGERSVRDVKRIRKKRDYEEVLDDYDPYMNPIKTGTIIL